MIFLLQDKPECFNHLDIGAWYRVTNRLGVPYAHFGVEILRDKAFVHFEMSERWTPEKMKQAVRDWEMLKGMIKGKGCGIIIASNYCYTDKAWGKMIKKFGFPDPMVVTIAISQQEI